MAYVLLVVAGFIGGVLNVISGGGSFLTLPILIFLGLPATLANGTNRVGVLSQNLSSVWGFHRHRVLDWRWSLWAGVPATIGAAFGSWAALRVGDEAYQRIFALFMLAVTLWTLLEPLVTRGRTASEASTTTHGSAFIFMAFFVVGLYGGFIQAGVGFLAIAVTNMAGLDLVRGSAVKVLSVFFITLLSLVMFAANGSVHWPMGIALAIGNWVGGEVGVRLTIQKGERWLRTAVAVSVVLFAIRLWFS